MQRIQVLIFLVFFLFTFSVSGQQGTDFSGEWVLNKEKSKFQVQQLAALEQAVVRIEHREPIFKLYRTFTFGGKEDVFSYELSTDGKEVESQEEGRKLFSKLYWEGDALVFVTRIIAPQGEAVNTVYYRLLEKGQVLQAEESFRGPRFSYDNLWVFEKR
ncbi:MAG: hypothetical protein GTO45_01255 [Candidatus Aminicenantes bacterium]|nr:hypothetical protein [Candidatus Aminicenantes bacterium]NIM77398.1 hypothetical protein [Candidatus Aminicenantes bacterium]NIN16695.1 hypothetical protein [Candidatus Aminicenantes bacterium]NIN40551.1 hypothetical protein [Candidatus Aminicenantes bacterium]NIN83371.1 hypothetical protein [Candidatus Aminicenantes bacterium]